MKTGNKGEWSELYVFFKLLADQKIFPGDANLNIRSSHFYPIVEILRHENGSTKTYTLSGLDIIIDKNSLLPTKVPISSFSREAKNLFSLIKTSNKTFTAPSAEAFLNSIGGNQIKANSTSKADIVVQVHDSRTNLQPILGFSIKSKLGSASTLLNAGHTTNFIYKLGGRKLTTFEVSTINSISTTTKVKGIEYRI